MRKYSVWHDNGTGHLNCAATIEAASKKAARATAITMFGTSSLTITGEGVDPNAWGASGNAHPNHREHAKQAMQRGRERLNEVAKANGYDTWSQLQTAIKRTTAIVIANPQRVTVYNDLGRYDFVMAPRDAEAFSLFCEQQGLVVYFEDVKNS